MAFPLRLSAFEEYMLLDSRPSFPMNFFLSLQFEGRLDCELWNAAISKALVLHPLLHANVERVGKRMRWVSTGKSLPKVELSETSALGGAYCDLAWQTGLRIAATEDSLTFKLLFQFHHSCCDGHGACHFLNDVLLAYAQAAGHESARLPEAPNLLGLRRRGRFGLTPLKLLRLAPRQTVGLLGARQFMTRRPQRLVDGSQVAHTTPPSGYPTKKTHRFSVDETRSICDHSKRCAVTLNDLLVRDLLLSIDEFKSRSEASDDHWLRLSVPVSLRDFVPADMPATNVLSFVFLDRRRPDMKDPGALLASLHNEMKLIKRNQLGLTFVLSLAVVRSLTGTLARLMPGDGECLATAVLTNPGILFKDSTLAAEDGQIVVGDTRLVDVEFIAPFRPNTSATFSAYTYANELRITLHYDSRLLSEQEAGRLHSNLVQRLSQNCSPGLFA